MGLLVGRFWATLAAAACLACSAWAVTPPNTWTLGAAGGVTYFSTSQSKVPQHLLKPTARVEFLRRVRGVDLGAAVSGVASGESGYRLVGAYALLKAPLYEGEVFDTALTVGVGLGSGARIQHYDLRTAASVLVWVKAGVAMKWWMPGNVALGLDLESEHVTTVNLSLTVTVRL